MYPAASRRYNRNINKRDPHHHLARQWNKVSSACAHYLVSVLETASEKRGYDGYHLPTKSQSRSTPISRINLLSTSDCDISSQSTEDCRDSPHNRLNDARDLSTQWRTIQKEDNRLEPSWVSRAELPLPEKQDVYLIFFTAIMALGEGHETCNPVDTVAVKAEWVSL